MISLVQEFHAKFMLPEGTADVLLNDQHAQAFRLGFLREEVQELEDALALGDNVGVFDALIDLVYVAYGTALFAGISPEQWDAGFVAVHQANMRKIRVARADDSKRGTAFDVRKPKGWLGPEDDLGDILNWSTNRRQGDLLK